MFVLPFLRKNRIADTCYRDTVGQNKAKKRALRDSHLKIYPCELRLSSFTEIPVRAVRERRFGLHWQHCNTCCGLRCGKRNREPRTNPMSQGSGFGRSQNVTSAKLARLRAITTRPDSLPCDIGKPCQNRRNKNLPTYKLKTCPSSARPT